MDNIIPLYPHGQALSPITRLYRECGELVRRMEQYENTSYEAQLAPRAELEGKLLTLSRLTPGNLQEGLYYTEAALCQLQTMITAWENQPTEAEAMLMRMLEQLRGFFTACIGPQAEPA